MSWDDMSGGQKAMAVVMAAIAVVAMCGRDSPEPSAATKASTPAPTRADRDENDMALMACSAAQREVKARLKSPATADFPSCAFSMNEYKITMNPEATRFGVQGFVDSQNSFGANIRSKFVVLLDKGPGSGSSDYRASDVAIE